MDADSRNRLVAETTNTLSPGCPCDRLEFPPKPDIPAGLAALPRQLSGFPEFRAAMLSHVASHRLLDTDVVPVSRQRPLQVWRAREGDDLGIMLLEMWAYVLDVLGFYEERIANEAYLQTAQREISLRRLVELIGYHPSPATAASVTLALLADTGKGLISIPKGSAFRSGAFDGEKPQVFEASVDSTIDPALNRWTLAAIRDTVFSGLYTASGGAKVSEDDFVLLAWTREEAIDETVSLFESPGSPVALIDADQHDSITITGANVTLPSGEPILYGKAAKVVAITSFKALDGISYRAIECTPAIAPFEGTVLNAIQFRKTVLDGGVQALSFATADTTVTLDSQQTDIRVNDIVLLARDSEPIPFRVLGVNHLVTIAFGEAPVSEDAVQPFILATELTLYPKPPSDWADDPSRLRLHFKLVDAGTLTRPAKDRIALSDLDPGAAFEGTVEPPQKEASGSIHLRGADGSGAELPAIVTITADGNGTLRPQDQALPFDPSLRVPVNVYGNLIAATRGETVPNEVLGNGDPTQAFQSFKLKKSPLTWLDDPSGFNGRRSTLSVRVNGILWTEVPSFYGMGPQDEVYIIRQNEENVSVVTFGDGVTGARLPRGAGNVTAAYRFGAGAAKPPANSITQIARAVSGLRQVVNPVAAGGGSDADSPEDLRGNASASSLLLGRAVSLADFEALAREFGGVINAHATWGWDGRMQRAVVKIWFISDGGSIEDDLRSYLLGQSDPTVPLEAKEAEAVEKSLVVDLAMDLGYNSDDVEQAVIDTLIDPKSGLLALENIPIGCPLFRSRVIKQIHDVAGVLSVRALRFDGQEAEPAITVEEGQYLDFTNQLVVGNTASSLPD
ncbi:MAG TPA: putative baseplate assembly protein [Terrimicrobiaceae bacterium]